MMIPAKNRTLLIKVKYVLKYGVLIPNEGIEKNATILYSP